MRLFLLLVALPCWADGSGRPHFLNAFRRGGASSKISKHIVVDDLPIKNTTEFDVSKPVSQIATVGESEKPLTDDIQLLALILSDIVEAESPTIHTLFEEFCILGLERAAKLGLERVVKPDDETKQPEPSLDEVISQMIRKAAKLTHEEALGVLRSFTIMLNLLNSAEVHHRIRVLRRHASVSDTSGGPLPMLEESTRGTMSNLLKWGLATKEQLYEQLCRQKVEIVLTAHPTEVQRKSLLRKYGQVSDLLAYLERPDLSAFEKTAAKGDLRRIISSIWGADEIRRKKPTPQQEAAGGNAIIEGVLWDAVPSFLRKLDGQVRRLCAVFNRGRVGANALLPYTIVFPIL